MSKQSQKLLFAEPASEPETREQKCRRILADCAKAGVRWKKPPKRRKARPRKETKC